MDYYIRRVVSELSPEFPSVEQASALDLNTLSAALEAAYGAIQAWQAAPPQKEIADVLEILSERHKVGSDVESPQSQVVAGLRWKFTLVALRQVGLDPTKLDPRLARHEAPPSPERQVAASPQIEFVAWEWLPQGQLDFSIIHRHFHAYAARNTHVSIDFERIKFAERLKPLRCVIGKHDSEFDGYIAFTFEETTKVLLESPMEGNAAYIFDGDWERLACLPKAELLSKHRTKFKRIIHGPAGTWQWEIRAALFWKHAQT